MASHHTKGGFGLQRRRAPRYVIRVRPSLLVILVLAGCARGSERPIDAMGGIDAPNSDGPTDGDVDPDGTPPDPDGPATPPGVQLLLTEVVLQQNPDEMIEIWNPTSQTVDLSTYHVSDNGSYFNTPVAGATIAATDFVVKFPAGATVAPGGIITIAIATAAEYQTKYGVAPSYSIGAGANQMTPVLMNGTPNLTNTGEVIVLFRWDGASDLVKDVDIMIAGAATALNGLVDKSGVAIDGPDGNATTSAYATDARTILAQPTSPAANQSTKRILRELGNETQTGGGNGITGDDETSEITSTTWDTTYTATTPGSIPASIQ